MEENTPARGILSCGSCRQRKLKCDRGDPCGNCLTRDTECVYVSYNRGRRTAQRRDNCAQMDARIRHLEQLINTVTAQQATPNSLGDQTRKSFPADGAGSSDSGTRDASSNVSHDGPSLDFESGHIVSNNNNQMTYVSSTHWASVCNEVADLRHQVDVARLLDEPEEHSVTKAKGTMLLAGEYAISNVQEALPSIPHKEIADKLISRYFNSVELSIVILHGPTFEKEYLRFWNDPPASPPVWVALLFGILAVGTLLYAQSMEELPGGLGKHAEVAEEFLQRSTECLILSKYSTSPGPYTIEALILNLQCEFLRNRDDPLAVWLMGGVAVRLSMRMGFHRDPSGYPQITPFEGEMRRRVWGCLVQLDTLSSYLLGLPPLIQDSQNDTQLPRNILDEDFGPETEVLPASRPETELTPILYTLSKGRYSLVFREIYVRAALGRIDSYGEVIALDQRLRQVRENISPRFRMADIRDSVTASPFVLIRRYSLEFYYLKSRCVLHRHHMAKSVQEPRYNFSRTACLESAMAILRQEADILKEVQTGGVLHRQRWVVTSLEQSDFLLASMIVCLELSLRGREATQPGPVNVGDGEHGYLRFSRQDLLRALEDSRQFLNELKDTSADCRHAFRVLQIMLQKFSEASGNRQLGQAYGSSSAFEAKTATSDPSVESSVSMPNIGEWQPDQIGATQAMQVEAPPMPTLFSPGAGGIESFFNDANTADWNTWEAFLQDSRHISQDPSL